MTSSSVVCVVLGDWLKPLKQFQDLHIFRHANKYANEPETTLKQPLNVLDLFQCFVSVLFRM